MPESVLLTTSLGLSVTCGRGLLPEAQAEPPLMDHLWHTVSTSFPAALGGFSDDEPTAQRGHTAAPGHMASKDSDSKALAFYSPGVTGSTVPNSQVGSGRETVAEHITKCNYHWPQLWDPDGSGGDCCKPLACALGTGRLLLGSP